MFRIPTYHLNLYVDAYPQGQGLPSVCTYDTHTACEAGRALGPYARGVRPSLLSCGLTSWIANFWG